MRLSDWRLGLARLRVEAARRLAIRAVPSVYGVRMRANWDDATFRFCVSGEYGTFFSSFLRTQSAPFAFLDIGANQGLYTLIAAANPGCRSVIAFEPVASTAGLLRENLALNAASRVTVHELAICDVDGEREIAGFPGHSGMTTLRAAAPKRATLRETIHCVSSAGLDALVPAGPRYVVKIDVEGLEEVVIEQAAACAFFPGVSHVFCEVDEDWIDAPALVSRMRALGFSTFTKVPGDIRHYDLMIAR